MLRTILAAALIATSWAAAAADIRSAGKFDDGLTWLQKITFSGKVVVGDASKIDRLLSADDGAVVFLDSNGGDYREGLKLAQLFAARKVRTALADGGKCLSACAIAFLGGSASGEEGLDFFARSISVSSRLGFHAPFINIGNGDLTAEAVENAYDHAIRTVTDFIRAAAPLGITPDVAADMMTPQRVDLYNVRTIRDVVRIGIEVHGIDPVTSLTRSMVRNLCLNSWIEPNGDWSTAEKEASRIETELKWPAQSTVLVKSAFMVPDAIDVKRTAIPVSEAGEGSGYYLCLVDHAVIDGKLKVAARGFILWDANTNAAEASRKFDPSPFEFGQPQYEAKFAIRSIDPLDRTVDDQELRFGVVPIDTEIERIGEITAGYLKSEAPM